MSDRMAVDALRMPFYSSRHHGVGDIDRGNNINFKDLDLRNVLAPYRDVFVQAEAGRQSLTEIAGAMGI